VNSGHEVPQPRQDHQQDRHDQLDGAMHRERQRFRDAEGEARDDREHEVDEGERVADQRLLPAKDSDRRADDQDDHHRIVEHAVNEGTDRLLHVDTIVT